MTPEIEIAVIVCICLAALAGLIAWVRRVSVFGGHVSRTCPPNTDTQTLYLVGRVRIAAGRKTVWDLIGIVERLEQAEAACTLPADFYVPQQLGVLRDDRVVVPAALTFPLRDQQRRQAEEPAACR
ncbi:hypothetical protein [Desulfuromonas thiophila]|uniref:hypothetical protein n=1 Tax=Desulfuromonas thiophila TaxID=57664 RepID=UPI0029F485C9|nr:hypothetical protein [Desulfuromonas thiophila]